MSTRPLTIRPATEADLPAVLALYQQPGFGDTEVLSLDEARAVLAEMGRYPRYRLFVGCEGGGDGPVRASYALLVMPNLAHRGAPSAIVEDVVVDQAHRGRGLGRQLMAHAVAEAAAAGCYKLALSSNARRTQAHAFYESLGFARHGLSFAIDPQHAATCGPLAAGQPGGAPDFKPNRPSPLDPPAPQAMKKEAVNAPAPPGDFA